MINFNSMDSAIRIFKLDLREKVKGIWDDNVPVVRHIVIEGSGIEANLIDKQCLIENLKKFCKILDLHVTRDFEHFFMPQGVSLVCLLEESHIAVHTWPEKQYVHVDMVSCTANEIDNLEIIKVFNDIFVANSVRIISLIY